MNLPAFFSTLSDRSFTLPIAIFYVTAGCNLRCITCSYREPLPLELSIDEYRGIFDQLNDLGLRRAVYSGGEPLVRADFPEICILARERGFRQTLLTNGLLLAKRWIELRSLFDEIIVSLDGPDEQTHDSIRGARCFGRILDGLGHVLNGEDRPQISLRFVVQRRNFRKIGEFISRAKDLGVDRVSFLAADVHSLAFNRDHAGPAGARDEIVLDPSEVMEFRTIMEKVLEDHADSFKRGFVSESPGKMMHLVRYFEALQGGSDYPKNLCNAPSVSLVITSTGDILPCYFLPAHGNVRKGPISAFINDTSIRRTRRQVGLLAFDECKRCVCTLKVHPLTALQDAF